MTIPTFTPNVTLGNIASMVISVVVWLGTLFFYGGRVTTKIDEFSKQLEQVGNWKSNLEARDNEAAASIRLEGEKNLEQDRRITIIETSVNQLVPDVREIKTKQDLTNKYLESLTSTHR